jgi:hypothetical protein
VSWEAQQAAGGTKKPERHVPLPIIGAAVT